MNFNSPEHSYLSSEVPSTSSSTSENPFSFSQTMEGFDFEFVPPVEQRYECPICLLILREPRQTKCGHRFCRDCIIRWLRVSGTRCPVDNEPLMENDVYPDNFAKREILNFSIRCPNKRDGCDKIVTLGKLQNHLDICPHSLVPCPLKCASILHRQDLEVHINSQCELRLISCDKCSESVKANSIENHIMVCPFVLLPCVYCGESRARAEMHSHAETECQQVMIRCRFYTVGCNDEMLRNMEEEHLKSKNTEHMKMLCYAVTNLFYQFENLCGSSDTHHIDPVLDGSNTTLPSFPSLYRSNSTSGAAPLVANCSPDVPPTSSHNSERLFYTDEFNTKREDHLMHNKSQNALEDSSNYLTNGTDTAHSNSALYNQGCRSVFNLEMRNPVTLLPFSSSKMDETSGKQNSALVRHIHELEEKLLVQQKKIDDLAQKLLFTEKANVDLGLKVRELEGALDDCREGRFFDGNFYWKIPEFSQYQMKFISGEPSMLHSPPFYTSAWGYKMCIRANIAGTVQDNAGLFLSLFIHLMQGQNDHFLSWPFCGKIVLSIIDQNPDQSSQMHISETLNAKPSLAAFQKPTSYRNHKGFGYIEFISLMTLKTKCYLKDDSLVVRVQVFPESK